MTGKDMLCTNHLQCWHLWVDHPHSQLHVSHLNNKWLDYQLMQHMKGTASQQVMANTMSDQVYNVSFWNISQMQIRKIKIICKKLFQWLLEYLTSGWLSHVDTVFYIHLAKSLMLSPGPSLPCNMHSSTVKHL